MNLNSRARHCVLTLIYSLYKWVNKYIGKKGKLKKAHHCPTREETEGGVEGNRGLKCKLGGLLKAHMQHTELAWRLLFLKDTLY